MKGKKENETEGTVIDNKEEKLNAEKRRGQGEKGGPLTCQTAQRGKRANEW